MSYLPLNQPDRRSNEPAAATTGGRDTIAESARANLLSPMEDVETAEAVTDLELQQIAYETALTAFTDRSHISLIDFLR